VCVGPRHSLCRVWVQSRDRTPDRTAGLCPRPRPAPASHPRPAPLETRAHCELPKNVCPRSALAGCTRLQDLVAAGNQKLESLEGLAAACGPSLRKLDASECGLGHGEILALTGCSGLRELSVKSNIQLGTLDGMDALHSLTELQLAGCVLADMGPLGPLGLRRAGLDLRRLPGLGEAVAVWEVRHSMYGVHSLIRR
jgi:hypothetical protein